MRLPVDKEAKVDISDWRDKEAAHHLLGLWWQAMSTNEAILRSGGFPNKTSWESLLAFAVQEL